MSATIYVVGGKAMTCPACRSKKAVVYLTEEEVYVCTKCVIEWKGAKSQPIPGRK